MISTTIHICANSWYKNVPKSEGTEDVLNSLIERWLEPHRHYHDIEHLYDVLYCIDTELSYEFKARSPEAIYLAAWYHDAIYDTRAAPGENELASAKLAYQDITEGLGLGEGLAQSVSDLVMMTFEHKPSCLEEGILSDADLSILRESPTTYHKYVGHLRQEYGWASDDQWKEGRSKFLEGMLAKEDIFYNTDHWYFEEQARQNMQAELSCLELGVVPSVA